MFTKIKFAIVLALLTAALGAKAELVFMKKVEFEALQPVAGKSGKRIQIGGRLLGLYYDTGARKSVLLPIKGARITFDAYRDVNANGTKLIDYGPVGGIPTTDDTGWAEVRYNLPAGAAKKLEGKYIGTFAGGIFNGVSIPPKRSSVGKVIVKP